MKNNILWFFVWGSIILCFISIYKITEKLENQPIPVCMVTHSQKNPFNRPARLESTGFTYSLYESRGDFERPVPPPEYYWCTYISI